MESKDAKKKLVKVTLEIDTKLNVLLIQPTLKNVESNRRLPEIFRMRAIVLDVKVLRLLIEGAPST